VAKWKGNGREEKVWMEWDLHSDVCVYIGGVLHPVGQSGTSVLEDNRRTTRGSIGTALVGSCLQDAFVLWDTL
jgi:hypothetical protein